MRLVFAVLLVLATSVAAQETTVPITALPVLEVPAVAEMGGSTVGRTVLDPRAVLQNPAALGLATRDASHAVSGAPTDVWFGESRYGAGVAAWGVRRGAVAAGVAVGSGAMRGTPRTLADGTLYDPVDRFQSLTLSAGTTGAVRVAAGATARLVTTTDAPVWDGSAYEAGRLRGMTADVGLLAAADVAALAGRPALAGWAPALDVSVGYAQTHIGGAVRYSGFGAQALPRMGALGWSARAGLDAPVGDRATLRVVEVEVARSAERLLAERTGSETSYAPALGGMALTTALAGEGDARTVGRQGARVSLAETIAWSWGTFDGWGHERVATRSWDIGTAGTARLLAPRLPGGVAGALARLDLRLGRTTVWAGAPTAQTHTTIALVVRR